MAKRPHGYELLDRYDGLMDQGYPFKRHCVEKDDEESRDGVEEAETMTEEEVLASSVPTSLSLFPMGEKKMVAVAEKEEKKMEMQEGLMRTMMQRMIAEEVRAYFDKMRFDPRLQK